MEKLKVILGYAYKTIWFKVLIVLSIAVIGVSAFVAFSTENIDKFIPKFEIPNTIYSLSLDEKRFEYNDRNQDEKTKRERLKFSKTKIPAGSRLMQEDFKFVINESLSLRLGEIVNTDDLISEKTYNYKLGRIDEWKESTGNFRVFTTEVQDSVTEVPNGSTKAGQDGSENALMAAITVSRNVYTGRGIACGMTEEQLDLEMGDEPYTVENKSDHKDRIYSYGDRSIIYSLKYGSIQCIQLILNNY